MPAFPHHQRRPAWARQLDRVWRGLAQVVGRALPRPTDRSLTALARQDRPAPPIAVPTPQALGVVDHLEDGRRAVAEGRFGEALFHFGALVEERPDNAWAWHGRGDALQLLGDFEDALAAYDHAAKLQPSEGLHHGGRSNALRALGRISEADAARAEALRRDPGLTWMWEA